MTEEMQRIAAERVLAAIKLERQLGEMLAELKSAIVDQDLTGVPSCSYCGSTSIYAKGLCRNCYARFKRNGTSEYKRKPFYGLSAKPLPPTRRELRAERLSKAWGILSACDFSILTDREREVLESRYKEYRTLDEIGKECQLTREGVRQILIRAERKLLTPQEEET